MPFEITAPVTDLDDAALADLLAQGRSELSALLDLDAPTDEDVTEAERIAPLLASLIEETERRATAAEAPAEPAEVAASSAVERMAAIRQAHAVQTTEAATAAEETTPAEPVEASAATVEPVTQEAPEVFREDLVQAASESDAEFAARQARYPSNEEASAETVTAAATRTSTVATVAARSQRPTVPARAEGRATLTAAADVPGFSAGADIDLAGAAEALLARTRGFAPPTGDGQGQDLRMFGVANIRKSFDDSLVADGRGDDFEIVMRAASESRLPGGSLVAAGGWCAPSETVYDLCAGETTDGIADWPEIGVKRGGIRFTSGPDFASLYASTGFSQTEAQAIAGTAKPCYEVTCPPFTEVRLDAVGLCIKVPILTNAAYPELVQRVVSGSLIAHQHRINARLISSAEAALTGVTGPDLGSSFGSTLTAVELMVENLRSRYRLSMTETMEGIAPHWLRAAIRADLSMRSGQPVEAVTNQQIDAHFAARGARIQWVYDWQVLADNAALFPTSAKILLYPAGTFVKGTSDVINLSAVYDAASLAQNVYTGVFFEEGVLLTKTCYSGLTVTVPVSIAGRTGAHDVVATGATPAV